MTSPQCLYSIFHGEFLDIYTVWDLFSGSIERLCAFSTDIGNDEKKCVKYIKHSKRCRATVFFSHMWIV